MHSMIKRAAVPVFWAAMLFAFVMATLPKPPEIPGNPSDKIQHICAFLALTALALFAYPRAAAIRILAGLSAFGALIEFVQSIPVLHRDAELLDWIADTAAVMVALLIGWLVRRGTGRSTLAER